MSEEIHVMGDSIWKDWRIKDWELDASGLWVRKAYRMGIVGQTVVATASSIGNWKVFCVPNNTAIESCIGGCDAADRELERQIRIKNL